MDNINGQNPYRILISSTITTEPVTIGDTVYEHFPIIKGDPLNAFMSTAQFSNTMIHPMNADFDGDQISCKPVWTKEGNADAERYINSNAYIVNITGKTMRDISNDFLLCLYNLTNVDKSLITLDCNKVAPKYAV